MTTTNIIGAPEEADVVPLGELLVASAKSARDRAAAQALAEDGVLIFRPQVRAALIVREEGRMTCRWEGMAGRVYSLGLDEEERVFLGLVLSMVGVGLHTLSAVPDLGERRLAIILRAILRLAGNDRLAVGTRL